MSEQTGKPTACGTCGFENPPGMRFCGQCGAALPEFCPACGTEIPEGARVCGVCGELLSEPGRSAGWTGAVDLPAEKEEQPAGQFGILEEGRPVEETIWSDLIGIGAVEPPVGDSFGESTEIEWDQLAIEPALDGSVWIVKREPDAETALEAEQPVKEPALDESIEIVGGEKPDVEAALDQMIEVIEEEPATTSVLDDSIEIVQERAHTPAFLRCKVCETDNPLGAIHCEICGAVIAPTGAPCPGCGVLAPPGAFFCSACGRRQGASDLL